MKKLTSLGRILFAIPFGVLGLNHFFMKDYYLGLVTSFIPGLGFSIFLVGLFLVGVSLSIIFNKYIRTSCFLLAGMLLVFIITIHIPNLWIPANKTIALIELMKDTALMGGALMIAGITKK